MNIICLVDRNLSFQKFDNLKTYHSILEKINELINVKTVFLDKTSQSEKKLLKNCNIIRLDEKLQKSKLPNFWEPIDDKKEKIVGTYDEFFKYIIKKNDENIFILGKQISFDLLKYSKYVYQISCNEVLENGEKFINLEKEENWTFEKSFEPFFEEGHMFNVVKYKNKEVMSYYEEPLELDLKDKIEADFDVSLEEQNEGE